MPHVAAHTDAVGSHSRSVAAVLDWNVTSSPGSNFKLTSSIPDARSFKSPTIDGMFHPYFKDFRLPTAYSRCVSRHYSLASPSFRKMWPVGTTVWSFAGSDSRHSSLIRASGPPEINFSTGRVTVSSNLVNRARAQAKNNILDQKINVGTALAEARKSIEYINSKMLTILRAWKLLQKGQFKRLYAYLKSRRRYTYKKVTSTGRKLPAKATSRSHNPDSWWLDYWYGFMPLLYDLFGALEQLGEGFKDDSFIFKATSHASSSLPPEKFFTVNPRDEPEYGGSAEQSCKTSLWGVVENNLSKLNSLGFLNPAVIIWELIPYSFVIDWLIPIGDWLQSLTATAGMTFLAGHDVYRIHARVFCKLRKPMYGTGSVADVLQAPHTRHDVMAMQRYVHNDWPTGLLYWKSPLSSNHLATTVALIKGARRNRRP